MAGHAVKKYGMIVAGDRLLVGVSGGKDSLLLMHVLTRLQARAPLRFDIVGVTVDMGFAGFAREVLVDYCRDQGWQHELVSLPGAELLQAKDAEERPCSLCSRLRRGQLHAVADRLGCNKLVLGQHLDDLCASFLMSLFRGGGLKTMGPHVAADGGRKHLIRPLCETSERLIIEAATPFHFPPIKSCPYAERLEEDGDRAYARRLLVQLESRFPGVRHAMLKSMSDLRPGHLLDLRYMGLTGEVAGVAVDDNIPEAL